MTPANRCLTLSPLPGRYAILKLAPDAEIPAPPRTSEFYSVTHASEELSIVMAEASLPAGVTASRGWCILKVHGPFAFNEIGVLAAIAEPLAKEKVSIFAISTYDTDYILLSMEQLPGAVEILQRAGHRIVDSQLGHLQNGFKESNE